MRRRLVQVVAGGAGDISHVVLEERGRKQINDWSVSVGVQGEKDE